MQKAMRSAINEMRKGLLIAWDYKFELLTQILMLGFVFVFVNVLLGHGRVEHPDTPAIFIGYVVWFYAFMMIGDMGNGLLGEARAGTLEQLYMSPAPSWMLLLGRVSATVLSTTLAVGCSTFALRALLGLHIPMPWNAVVPFGVTVLGLVGFGFLISGAALLFKRIDSLANLLQNALLFLNGALLPIDMLPRGLRWLAQALPTTQGIVVIRRVALDGQPLSALLADGSLLLLAAQSAGYLVAGWMVFRWCERAAMRRGTLAQY